MTKYFKAHFQSILIYQAQILKMSARKETILEYDNKEKKKVFLYFKLIVVGGGERGPPKYRKFCISLFLVLKASLKEVIEIEVS